MCNLELRKKLLWVTLLLILLFLSGVSAFAPTTGLASTTATPDPNLTDETSIFVPRIMLPAKPYVAIEILGKTCDYETDSWNEKTAIIAYACPDLNVTWLTVQFTNLEENETATDLFGPLPGDGAMLITPGGLFEGVENLEIFGKAEDSEYTYFMVYETETYVICSEVYFPEDADSTLQTYYLENGEAILNAVLEIELAKISAIENPLEPTPMAVNQRVLYDEISDWLVSESDVNVFYQGAPDMFGDSFDGTWASLGDNVNAQQSSVCREFEDRSNADAPLVAFFNCVYVKPGYELESLQAGFPNSTVLESTFDYPEQSIIYGHGLQNGHTSLNAFILQDDYVIYVYVQSRTRMNQEPEDVFNGFNDGFIYSVLMANLEHYAQYFEFINQNVDPFLGNWVSSDPGDGSNQLLSISKNDGEYYVEYFDEVASMCGLDSNGNAVAATGAGLGTLNGNVLSVELSIYCETDPQSFLGSFPVDIPYDESTNTIGDSETVWSRP